MYGITSCGYLIKSSNYVKIFCDEKERKLSDFIIENIDIIRTKKFNLDCIMLNYKTKVNFIKEIYGNFNFNKINNDNIDDFCCNTYIRVTENYKMISELKDILKYVNSLKNSMWLFNIFKNDSINKFCYNSIDYSSFVWNIEVKSDKFCKDNIYKIIKSKLKNFNKHKYFIMGKSIIIVKDDKSNSYIIDVEYNIINIIKEG